MAAVAQAFTQAAFGKYGNECLAKGKEALEEQLPTLQQAFINSCRSELHIEVPTSRKNEMVRFIVERTANAFYGFEEKRFREIHTGRKGMTHTANNFRTHLKSICTEGVVADKQALEKAEVKKKRKI